MIHLNFHQNWWHRDCCHQNLMIFSSLKKSPISSNHQNFHQNWWHKKPNIGRNYCHQNWWHFRHSKTHQFLQFTKNVSKIGEKFGKNSIENSNHQNFHKNWWKFWRKFNRKWMWAPTSLLVPEISPCDCFCDEHKQELGILEVGL